jgi:hypothetical protein
VAGLPDPDKLMKEGLHALEIHRSNFEGDGTIQQLQILMVGIPPGTLGKSPERMSNELFDRTNQGNNSKRPHDGRTNGDCYGIY